LDCMEVKMRWFKLFCRAQFRDRVIKTLHWLLVQ
jgi:hypothetical protein